MKAEKIVTDWILNGEYSFTWYTDILEHTIWGFKNAPYKNYERAMKIVKKVVGELSSENIIEVVETEYGDLQPAIYLS
jgi:hypothetical protein